MNKNPQVNSSHYFESKYDNKGRFCSYWHQINEILKQKPVNVLEVGIGNGLVSEYLKKRGVNLTTLDIDNNLRPDVVGSVLDLPFSDNYFEVAACYEVLEHIPYEDVSRALSELYRVSSNTVLISLPDRNRVYQYLIQLPKLGKRFFHLPLPKLKKQELLFDGEHYWEIGRKGFPLQAIEAKIADSGLEIEKSYRVFEHPFHRFFVCKKAP